MTAFFLLICGISILFFTVFLVGSSLSVKKSSNRNRKSRLGAQVASVPGG